MMKKVQSTVKPEPLVIDDYSAWIAEDIQEITVKDEEGKEHIEYEYKLTQLSKDEYIKRLQNKVDDEVFQRTILEEAVLNLMMEGI